MPPDPPRTLAPAARAKNAFGIFLAPPIAKMLRGPRNVSVLQEEKTRS